LTITHHPSPITHHASRITHPAIVDAAIEEFLGRYASAA